MKIRDKRKLPLLAVGGDEGGCVFVGACAFESVRCRGILARRVHIFVTYFT
jgi:hypothetical protein